MAKLLHKYKFNYQINIISKILTPIDISAAPQEFWGRFFIRLQIISTTL